MDSKKISALVLLVAATIAIMSIGSLTVQAKSQPFKFCFDEGLPGGPVNTLCYPTKSECNKNLAQYEATALTGCYKNLKV